RACDSSCSSTETNSMTAAAKATPQRQPLVHSGCQAGNKPEARLIVISHKEMNKLQSRAIRTPKTLPRVIPPMPRYLADPRRQATAAGSPMAAGSTASLDNGASVGVTVAASAADLAGTKGRRSGESEEQGQQG